MIKLITILIYLNANRLTLHFGSRKVLSYFPFKVSGRVQVFYYALILYDTEALDTRDKALIVYYKIV